jgi:hypothetical protein
MCNGGVLETDITERCEGPHQLVSGLPRVISFISFRPCCGGFLVSFCFLCLRAYYCFRMGCSCCADADVRVSFRALILDNSMVFLWSFADSKRWGESGKRQRMENQWLGDCGGLEFGGARETDAGDCRSEGWRIGENKGTGIKGRMLTENRKINSTIIRRTTYSMNV